MHERPDWDVYFMQIAQLVKTRATCPRRFVGALIVRDRQILCTGYNGAPRGLPHCPVGGPEHDWPQGCMKAGHCIRTLHAEQNAILQAAKLGVSCDGAGNEVSIAGKVQLGSAAAGATAAFGGANQKNGFWAYTSGSGTTGATGLISFPHGLGYAPGSADVAVTGNNANVAKVVSIDATNINCVVYTPTVVLNTGAVNVTMRLYY